MFEGISFYHLNLDAPSDEIRTKRLHENSGIPSISEELARYYDPNAGNAHFLLQGKNQILSPHPVTDHARAHFLYLQSFGLLDATPMYFTRRQNYASVLVLYTYAGQGALDYAGEHYEIPEGSGFLIDCIKPHYYHTTGSHWYHCLLHLGGADAGYLTSKYFQATPSPVFTCRQQTRFQEKLEDVARISEQISPMREYNTSLALGELLSYLIAEHEKSSGCVPDYLVYLRRYLENHYTNAFTLDELARFSSVSKYHLVHEFKKYIGFSPIDYLIGLRLERASFLLKNSPLPIEKIAILSGFTSYANFLKIFQKRYGQTPSAYRG